MEGEGVGPETEWISLRSGRRSMAAISVERGSSHPRDFRLAPQRAGGQRHRENRSAFREAIARGLDESVVLSRPGNRLTTAEAGRVTVFSERTFRFVVCRFLVRGIVRRPFCGGRR